MATGGLLVVPDELRARERLDCKVYLRSAEATKYICDEIAQLIRQGSDKPVVLSFARGLPVGVYEELIRQHQENGLSFKNVIAFGMDEYYPIDPTANQSLHTILHRLLFSHIDILPENVHLPRGDTPEDEVSKECARYEKLLEKHPIDITILGVMSRGDLGFNDAGSSIKSVTRVINLNRQRRKDVASSFFGVSHVPRRAVTVGISSILSAKKIFLLALSENNAPVVRDIVEGPMDPIVPSSCLQSHGNTEVVLDMAAANNLTRITCPWTLITPTSHLVLKWDDQAVSKAVIWLSLRLKRSILKLREEDYISNSLEQLLEARGGSVQPINRQVFKFLQSTITGWPGGQPDATYDEMTPSSRIKSLAMSSPTGSTVRVPQDYVISNYQHIHRSRHPRISSEYPKRIIIFSPHPDDDVISMGGTMIRLVEQGHIVHVAYQTSGNYAVWDDDVRRFVNFTSRFSEIFGGSQEPQKIEEEVEEFFKTKLPGQVDPPQVLKIKGLIRETEARNAARFCGVHNEQIHFLNLPFYESGTQKKKPMGEADIAIVSRLLENIQPHQIYAAGDLSDPHGTHRVCLQAIIGALHVVKKEDWFSECQVWLYRGAWQEWEPHQITMAVPMSPEELLQKRYAIFKHQSQKDPAPFPGNDKREFWQRSEARNKETAALYDCLGLTDYEGMEAFVEYDINNPANIL